MSPHTATLRVYTFKAGVLGKLGHDLRLSLRDFEVRLRGTSVEARFATASFVVDGVAHGRKVDPEGLSSKDKSTIEGTIRELLESAKTAEARYHGEVVLAEGGRPRSVAGRLTLRGVEQAIDVQLEAHTDHIVASAAFAPTRFGIAPYKALAGAIRLQDRVEIELRLNVPEGSVRELLAEGSDTVFAPQR